MEAAPEAAKKSKGNGPETLNFPCEEIFKSPIPRISVARLAELFPDHFSAALNPDRMISLPAARLAQNFRFIEESELIAEPLVELPPPPAPVEDISFPTKEEEKTDEFAPKDLPANPAAEAKATPSLLEIPEPPKISDTKPAEIFPPIKAVEPIAPPIAEPEIIAPIAKTPEPIVLPEVEMKKELILETPEPATPTNPPEVIAPAIPPLSIVPPPPSPQPLSPKVFIPVPKPKPIESIQTPESEAPEIEKKPAKLPTRRFFSGLPIFRRKEAPPKQIEEPAPRIDIPPPRAAGLPPMPAPFPAPPIEDLAPVPEVTEAIREEQPIQEFASTPDISEAIREEPPVEIPVPPRVAAIAAPKPIRPEPPRLPKFGAKPEVPKDPVVAPPVEISPTPIVPAAKEEPLFVETVHIAREESRESLEIPNQESIQSLFLTEEFLSVDRVVELCGGLPGVKSCVLTRGAGVVSSHNVPDNIDLVSLSAHAMDMLRSMRESSAKMGVGSIPAVTIHSEKGPITFFNREDLCLLVLHADRGFIPGVREKLQSVVIELSKANIALPVGNRTK